MHNKKKVHGRLLRVGTLLLVIGSGSLLFLNEYSGYEQDTFETQLIVNEPIKESAIPEQGGDFVIDVMDSVMEDEANYALTLTPVATTVEDGQGNKHEYAYVEADIEEFKTMTREDYHDFIDRICKYSYEYFTVIFGNGKGIVFYPRYAQWALYGTLNEDKTCKEIESYIDASDELVETITKNKITQIKKYITDITKEYKKNGTYLAEVEFLYDNIFEVRLTIDIKSDQLKDAKNVIKKIEQKTNIKGYMLNFKITCMNGNEEVVTMSFGEEQVQYVYVENGHKVTLDSLD
ncbi:MAG: hypothetical protein Q4G58_08480 [bacterium]|nr:hypothetical protein [bacterium]